MALFTVATARQASAKAVAKRSVNRAKRAADLDAARALLAAYADATPQETADQSPEFQSRRLSRVRIMLDRIDERLQIASDPLDLDRLARAAASLQEQERTLSGRPLPGQLRPVAPRSSRSTLVAPSLPAPSLSTPLLNSAEKPASTSSADSSTSNPPLPPAPEHP